jgi:spore maturation protein CgeB
VKRLTRAFLLAPDCHGSRLHYGPLWQRHFYDGLTQVLARSVIPRGVDFSWARPFSSDPGRPHPARAKTSQQIKEQILAAQAGDGLDAVFSYCFAGDLELDLVRATVKSGVPWINFYCDSTHRFAEVEPIARCTALNWFPERAALPQYQALGVPFLCAPYALNPAALPDLTGGTPVRSVTFVGMPTADRINQLGWLKWHGVDLEIHGFGWDPRNPSYPTAATAETTSNRWWRRIRGGRWREKILKRIFWRYLRRNIRGPLSDDDYPKHLRGTEMVLGLNQAIDATGRSGSYLKFRDLEVPGYGCCYLAQSHPDLAAVFEAGKEILLFDTLREAAELAAYYHQHATERAQIGAAGRRRVLAEHTWQNRLKQLERAL